jgi:hypothetical protein
MRTLRFAFVLFYFSLAYVQAQESGGIIAGKVFNEQGQPVVGAQVCVGRTEVKDEHLQIGNSSCLTKTDDSGQLRLENVSMGTVTVSARKSEDGYCGPHAPYPRVTLSAASPLANVVLNLGRKEGMVAPVVADLATGQPIFNFMVRTTIHDAEHPNEPHQEIAGGFSRWSTSLCVPANTDLSLEVSAKGYKAVAYPSPTQLSEPATIRLRSGETMSFQVGLSPELKVDPNAHDTR